MSILTTNLVFSTLVFWIAASIYVLPRLDELGPRPVLLPVLLLHSFTPHADALVRPDTIPGVGRRTAEKSAATWRAGRGDAPAWRPPVSVSRTPYTPNTLPLPGTNRYFSRSSAVRRMPSPGAVGGCT